MPSYRAGVLALGPLFYYRLDETSGTVATDSSGNGRNGTYTATGVTYSAASLLASDADTAVTFNGSTGYVSVANALIADTFTLEAWIKPTTTAAQGYIIGSGSSGAGGLTMMAGGQLACDKTGVVQICNSGAATVTAGTTHHVVYTKAGATNHLYLDGVDVTTSVANATCTSPGTTTIGQVLGSFNFFNGTVDEVAIYGFALTAGQVTANYTNGTTVVVGVGPPQLMPTVIVEVAFANNPLTPLASLTWTNITQYCQTITTAAGRQVETAQVVPGTLTVRLWNADSRFSPFNTASPYYGPFTDGGNPLLSAQISSLEDGTTTGWTVGQNCTLSNSTAQALVGTHSLALTSTAPAMSATLTAPVAVSAGQQYTATVNYRAATVPRTIGTYLQWYDGSLTPTTAVSMAGLDTTTGWTALSVTGAAPAGTAYASVQPTVSGTAAGEVHYADSMSLSSAVADTGVLGLVPGKRIRVRATWAGTTYNVWHGFIDAWPMGWPSEMTAYVDVTATDGFKLLNLRTLGSVYAETISADKPLAWYRLGDASVSNTATATAPLGTTGAVAPYPVSVPLGVTFGGPALIAQDPNASATFSGAFGASLSIGRYAIQTGGSSYTVEMWVQTTQSSGIVGLVCQGAWPDRWGVTFNTATNVLQMVVATFNTIETVTVNAAGLNNGKPHYVCAVRDDFNFINALAFDTTTATAATVINSGYLDADIWIGGGGSGAVGATVNLAGQIQDVAIYTRALTIPQMGNHFYAGSTALGNETSGARINRILNYVGWPAADRTIDAGVSLLQGSRQQQTALAELLATVAAEGAGLCFMSPDGRVTFYDRRHTAANATSVSSQLTLGESGEPYELANTAVGLDDLDVWNDIQVTRQNGVTAFAEDLVSRARYGQRTLAVTGLMMSTDAQAADLAQYWLVRYRAPLTRVKTVNVHPLADGNTLFPQVLGRTLLDQVTVTRTPPGGGAPFNQPSIIERISHTIDPVGDWHTTFGLSAADTARYWVLQDATYGILNSTSKLYF